MFAKILLVPLLIYAATECDSAPANFGGKDREAITAVMRQYTEAWLKYDQEEVMALFVADAVLIPHHGVPPVEGKTAIRRFWWPEGPPTTIVRFIITSDQIGGSGEIAYTRGKFDLEWITGGKRSQAHGNHLTLLRKEADGRWRITHQMWGDPP